MLDIIGKYPGRLYMEAKRRPLFVIDTIHQTYGSMAVPLHSSGVGVRSLGSTL
jgi:hypothetical protein